MGWFSKSDSGSSGSVSSDGQGGFTSVDNNGVTSSSGGDPVDNLIALASNLADQDDAS